MSNIVVAKRELYHYLITSGKEIAGAGIKEKDGKSFIVIFLQDNDPFLLSFIPSEFKGNPVCIEIQDLAYSW